MDGPPKAPLPFRTAFWFWLKLGFISFGGPAGQIAIMHTELVEQRRWISERRFLHALNYCMVLPGPEAQQLAVYIGWLLHGTWGGIVAGTLFVVPGYFLLVGLSWVYLALGELLVIQGLFYGMKPAVVAIVLLASIRIGQRAIRNLPTLLLAGGAFLGMTFHVPFPLLLVLAGLIGYLGSRFAPAVFSAGGHAPAAHAEPAAPALLDDDHELPAHARPSAWRFGLHLCTGLLLWFGPMLALVAWQGLEGLYPRLGLFFTLTALVTFGGAYAVLPFVTQHAIARGWLTELQMVDGLALGETTPGPLILIVTFVGFLGGWQTGELGVPGALLGGLVATYFTFLPSFLFILLGAPIIETMRGQLRLTAILSGITAAVVGVILHLAVFIGQRVILPEGRVDLAALALTLATLLTLRFTRLGIVPVVLGSGLLGLAYFWLAG